VYHKKYEVIYTLTHLFIAGKEREWRGQRNHPKNAQF